MPSAFAYVDSYYMNRKFNQSSTAEGGNGTVGGATLEYSIAFTNILHMNVYAFEVHIFRIVVL